MRAPPLLLLLLLPVLGLALRPPQPPGPEARTRLCGHHLVRALVRVCGGPRWSPEPTQPADAQDGELLRWLEQRQLLYVLATDSDPDPNRQPRPRQRRDANPALHCCLNGCSQQDLRGLCPQ